MATFYPKVPITLLCVGRLKGSQQWLASAFAELAKRLSPYAQLTVVEVAAESPSPTRSPQQAMEVEGQRLLAVMQRHEVVVFLSERGKHFTSQTFAQWLGQTHPGLQGGKGNNPSNGGSGGGKTGAMLFVVGGPWGVAPVVEAAAHHKVSLSSLTFPHDWVRLLWIEQVYRAFRQLHGLSYHL
jgi:23S rRNA (pseudouridine1915-N3)-methyltransferase